eukprot:7329377-Prymnesium_polylepis.1
MGVARAPVLKLMTWVMSSYCSPVARTLSRARVVSRVVPASPRNARAPGHNTSDYPSFLPKAL